MNAHKQLEFDGRTFDAAQDGKRLTTQFERVRAAMSDGRWWTLSELAERCGGTEAAISARIRDLRKAKFGGGVVERERVSGGLWRYRVVTR